MCKFPNFGLRLFFVCILLFGWISQPIQSLAFSDQVIRMGAVGDDVIELQSRLKYIGFYKGKVDAVFGYRTYWALRNFQEQFGMPVDGLAGEQVKNKLVAATKYNPPGQKGSKGKTAKKSAKAKKSTTAKKPAKGKKAKKKVASKARKPATKKGSNMPNGFSNNDLKLMANAVYGEARGEPYTGQVAVAAVILNRLTNSSFPNTIAGIIYQPLAFTAVADGQINLTPNETAKKAVLDAVNGWDPSGGCIYYFNPKTATSKWIWTRPQVLKIGEHIFCK